MSAAAFIALTLVAFAAMEVVAALMHRFVMHGPLWSWHEDHHVPRRTAAHRGAVERNPFQRNFFQRNFFQRNFFQRNDRFALMFAIPSWLLIMTGMQSGPWHWRTAIGFGILLYGIVYTLVHEHLIHRRFPWKLHRARWGGSWYLQALREAHAVHHQRQTRRDCVNFGMLLVPAEYYRRHLRLARSRGLGNSSVKTHRVELRQP